MLVHPSLCYHQLETACERAYFPRTPNHIRLNMAGSALGLFWFPSIRIRRNMHKQLFYKIPFGKLSKIIFSQLKFDTDYIRILFVCCRDVFHVGAIGAPTPHPWAPIPFFLWGGGGGGVRFLGYAVRALQIFPACLTRIISKSTYFILNILLVMVTPWFSSDTFHSVLFNWWTSAFGRALCV